MAGTRRTASAAAFRVRSLTENFVPPCSGANAASLALSSARNFASGAPLTSICR